MTDDGNMEVPFVRIEDVIHDIAFIFHWPRSKLWVMPLRELLDSWRDAVRRFMAAYAADS